MRKQLLLIMMIMLPLLASADDSGSCGVNVTWNYVESTHTLTISGTGDMDLPYDAEAWRGYVNEIQKIVVEEGVTSVSSEAFAFCENVTSVELPEGLASMGYGVFYNCSKLASIIIPQSVTAIGNGIFYGCSSLTSVTIPKGVTSIDGAQFRNCSSLATVIVESGNTKYDSRDNCNAIIETATNTLISGCSSTTIPAGVTSIGKNALATAGVTSVTLPNSVTKIGESAFEGCNSLTSIIIPNTVTTIESYAFMGCGGLKSITLPEGLTTISGNVFRSTGLTSITIPDGVQSIGESAFYYCQNLTSVTIPGTVKTIGENAFNYCKKLESIVIPNGVTTIGVSAFSDCLSLTTITIPKSVTSIGVLALARTTSLSTIAVESGNTKYDSRNNCNAIIETSTNALAFGCKKTVIPNTVTAISSGAFQGCTTLTSIVIPESVTSIDDYAFSGATGLVTVTVKSAVPLTISGTFPNRKNATLYVPVGSKAAYEAATGWKDFKEIVEGEAPSPTITFADAKVKSICVQNWDTNKDGELSEAEAAAVTDLGTAFCYIQSFTSFNELSYFTGLKSIGEDAFNGCRGLTSVRIPNSVKWIDDGAFMGCTELISIKIPNSVTYVGEKAFCSCYNLTTVILGNNVQEIGNSAFYGCKVLSSVTIPKSVTIIGDYAFGNCTGITSITVESGNPTYDSRDNCNAIIETSTNTLIQGFNCSTIPSSVTAIGKQAFNNHRNLSSVTIPQGVTSIGEKAFYLCTALTSVTVENSSPVTIDKDCFTNSANATLYVPYGSKAAYQAADYWKDFKEIVEPIVPGSAEAPFTCAEAIAFVTGLSADTPTETEYYVKGKVCKMQYNYSYQYGSASFWISDDGTDNGSFYVYRTLYFEKEKYNGGRVPNIGDEVVLCGKMINYQGTTPETASSQCRLVSLNDKTVGTGLEVGDLFVAKSLEDVEMFFVVDKTGMSLGKTTVTGCSVGYAVANRPETYTNAPACINSNYEGPITIPETVEGLPVQVVAPSAFAGAKLTSVVIPSTVWDIETNAFKDCQNLASVKMPENVILNTGTFKNCTSLTSVELPKGVQLWAMDIIFSGCTNLTAITVNDETPYELQGNYLVDDPSSVTLYVPIGSKAAYEAADYWKEFGEIIEKEPEVPVNEIWSGSQVIKEWSNLTLGKEYMESLNIGDVLHVTVTDVAESEANVALLDGSWTGIAPWYGLSPEMTEAVFTLTGDMVRELKRYGMVLSCHGYTIKRIYTTPAYTGSENSIWLGNQTNGDISVGFDHFHIANRKTGIKAGDVIRLSYTGNGTPNVWYIGDDWTWKEFTDATLSTTETGAEVTVTGAMATLLNNDKDLIVQLGDAGLTLTQVELISGAHTVVYQVGEGETFASGTQKELENITLTYGETGGVDFQTATAWTCEAEGLEFPYYSPGNGINGNKDGGTFYVFKPKKNGLLTVVVNQNAIKPFYVEENGSVMDQFNGITKGEDGTYQGTYKIEVKANRTYKVYCSGSKLGFYGFIYDWRDNAHLINIEFADANVKALCVENWDTNGDGELSEAEAAAVTDLGEVFKGNTEITSFNELQYFIGLTNLGNEAFRGCGSLTAIIIPNTVTSIGDWAFASCENLESITIPNSVTSIKHFAFYNCFGLTSLVIPQNVTSIESAVLAGCRNIISVTVESGNTVYDSRDNCNAIIKTATNLLVAGCPKTTIPESVTSIGDDAFHGCNGMTSVTLPNALTSIGNGAFSWNWTLLSINIPASVTSIGAYAFNGCGGLTSVVVNNSSPVSISEDTFSNRANATLYVPVGCVAAYRAADYWKEFGTIMSYGSSSLYAEDLQTLPGTMAVLAVNLDNVDKAIACKFDLRLPAGVTVATTSNGKLDATLTERAENHSISSNHLDNGDYRFVITSHENDLFTGNSGALVEIKLDIPLTMECGDYTVQVFNTDLTAFGDNTSTNVKLDDMDSKLTVTYMRGDVNCDGSVSVTDVGCTINYILERVPEVFVKEAADMDGDNEINVTDVTKIIDFILDDDASMAPRRSGYDPVIPHLSLQQTADGYALTMDEKDAFVGFQFDVELAARATVNSMQLNSNSDHLLTYRRLDNGMYRVVCYSLSNSTFADDEAPLLNMFVTGDVSVSSVLLTTAGLTGLRATVSDDQSTGIASMNQALQMSVQGRTLQIVADRDVTLRLYTTGGSVYRVLNVHSGVNTFEGLKAGVYMIENRKMIIR